MHHYHIPSVLFLVTDSAQNKLWVHSVNRNIKFITPKHPYTLIKFFEASPWQFQIIIFMANITQNKETQLAKKEPEAKKQKHLQQRDNHRRIATLTLHRVLLKHAIPLVIWRIVMVLQDIQF